MSFKFALLIPALILSAGAAALAVDPHDLPRVPPTAPADAIKTFQVHKGLKIEAGGVRAAG